MVETKKKTIKKKSVTKKKVALKSKSSTTKKIVAKVPQKGINQNLIMSIVLGLFIIISAFQSIQISELKTKIDGDGVKISTGSSSSQYSSSGSSGKSTVPSNVADLPQMVGGC